MSALPERDFQALSVGLVPLSTDPALAALDDPTGSPQRERRELALRDDLAAIAAKTGQRIVIPERPFTLEEWQAIRLLRSVLRTARVRRTWTTLAFSMTPAQVRQIIETHGDAPLSLLIEQADGEIVALFGVDLPLGWCRYYTGYARLTNSAELRVRLATSWSETTPIRLNLVPVQDTTLEIAYPEWGLTATATGKERQLDAAERIVLLEPAASQRLNWLLGRQQEYALPDAEQAELDALVAEHRQRSVERAIGLYSGRNRLEIDAARALVTSQLAEAEDWRHEFESDPERVEAAVALARQRRARADG